MSSRAAVASTFKAFPPFNSKGHKESNIRPRMCACTCKLASLRFNIILISWWVFFCQHDNQAWRTNAMNQANCKKSNWQENTYFSNEDDFLGLFLNHNFYLYKIFCIWPGFVVHHIYLEIWVNKRIYTYERFGLVGLMIMSCWQSWKSQSYLTCIRNLIAILHKYLFSDNFSYKEPFWVLTDNVLAMHKQQVLICKKQFIFSSHSKVRRHFSCEGKLGNN